MQRNRENSDDEMKAGNLFDDFRDRTSTMPSIFGGRDPFDDPFTRPFGSISGSGMFNSSGPFGSSSQVSEMKGPVIEELFSEDEGEEADEGGHDKSAKSEKCEASNVDCSNKDPIVEHPDDEDNEKQRENKSRRANYNKVQRAEPHSRIFSFQKVTYGGVDGTYYTATTSRRKGNDGALLEESKEADKTTGQATHRISRGLHDRVKLSTDPLGTKYMCIMKAWTI
ncbi:hypothetical protein AgCh_016636 [Apium graveolens]